MSCAKHLLLFGILKVLCIIYAQEELTTRSVPRRFTHYGSPYLLSGEIGDFYTFDYECKSVGLVPAAVHYDSQHFVLAKFLEDSKCNSNLWIGGSNLGSKHLDPRFYYWTYNGEEITYSTWAPGYPPPPSNQSKCTHVNADKPYLWETENCFYNKHKFLCMHPLYVYPDLTY